MKNRLLAVLTMTTLLATMMAGCGKKDVPQEEPPAAVEASTEEATVEAPAEASVEATSDAAAEETSFPLITADLDETIGNGIIICCNNLFKAGETQGEGHILMDKEEPDENGEIKCYVLETFGAYEFQDGNFVECAGSGVIPAVVTVKKSEDGTYEFVSMVEAEDGSGFVDSIKENFPEALWSRCITIEDDDRNELEKQKKSYAEEYLATIGREDVEVGDYGDFEHTLLTDEGVSVDVSNKMLDVQSGDGFEFFCPMWIGEREVLEENVRYTYKTEYDQKNKQIIFSKVLYETGEVLETSTYDATTGDKVD
jgi:bla regulator protein BlaR1